MVSPDVYSTLYQGRLGDLPWRQPHRHGPQTGFARAHSGILYRTMVTGNDFIWNALDNVGNATPAVCSRSLRSTHASSRRRGAARLENGGTFCVIRTAANSVVLRLRSSLERSGFFLQGGILVPARRDLGSRLCFDRPFFK